MKTKTKRFDLIFFAVIAMLLFSNSYHANAEVKSRERNILANKAKSIDLANVLIKDLTWNNLPDYKNR